MGQLIRAVMISVTVAAAASACAAPGLERSGWVLQPEVSASFISEEAGDPTTMRALGAGGRLVRQMGRYGVGFGTELNLFETRTVDDDPDRMAAVLAGADLSVLSGEGYIRSSTSLGTAILLEGSELDEAGSVGFYWEVRAVTFRFLVDDDLVLAFSPLSGVALVPEPSGIPLVDIQYRMNLAVEFL